MSILLQARNIEHSYREGKIVTPVLKGVNLDIESSKMTAIVGKSGSGKSTLLHILGTLDTPDKGQVIFQDQDVTQLSETQKAKFRNHHLGFIYQFHHLLDDFTVLENVMLPLMISKTDSSLIKSRALHLLERVGLQDRLKFLPSELSGGERQRVAIARAMVHSPELILADEPTGNLDEENAATVFNLFRELVQDEKTAVVMVTHDLSLAHQCDEIFEMVGGVVMPKNRQAEYGVAKDDHGLSTTQSPAVKSTAQPSDTKHVATSDSFVTTTASTGAIAENHLMDAVSLEAIQAQQSAEMRSLHNYHQDDFSGDHVPPSSLQATQTALTNPVQPATSIDLASHRTNALSEATPKINDSTVQTIENDEETVIVVQHADSNHALDLEHRV